MRLEVTLSGEFYRISAQKLTKDAAKRMRDAYGKQWRQVLNRLAVGSKRKDLLNEVAAKTGQVPPVEYQRTGILLGSDSLGLAISLDDAEVHAERLDQATSNVRPSRLMKDYAPDDVLAVFSITGGGFLRCVFPGVKDFKGELLRLECDEMGALLNRKTSFELVHSMTYGGSRPEKMECVPAARMEYGKQVFHAKRT